MKLSNLTKDMSLTRPPLHSSFLLRPSLYTPRRLYHATISASNGENNATTTNSGAEIPPPAQETSTTTTKQQKRKLKVKSRRRQRGEEEERLLAMAASSPGRREKEVKKKGWEEMTLAEKAVELYVGEKGALFWLNKFAYASIFIVIGGWILFRFVGPSIGLYQLESPFLTPSDLFSEK